MSIEFPFSYRNDTKLILKDPCCSHTKFLECSYCKAFYIVEIISDDDSQQEEFLDKKKDLAKKKKGVKCTIL